MELEGVPALITGGASGLGAATAEALVEAGAEVGILDIDAERAASTADRLEVEWAACDVADGSSSSEPLAYLRQRLGAPRLLVNCAGIQRIAAILDEDGGPMPLETFVDVVRVNLVGTFNMTRLAVADMAGLERLPTGERGVVINVSSIAAHEGQPGRLPYCASKGGVLALTLPLARELGPLGVRAVSISPGHFSTSLGVVLTEEQKRSHRDSLVFPERYGHPAEFADLVIGVCRNPMINGTDIRIDAATRMPKH